MNTYFSSLYYGVAVALGFIGLFGLLIDSNQWLVSVGLIVVSVLLALMTYWVRKYE